ncbi:MAG: hypothetical protein ACR2PS_15305, partial [Pseudomonadales bacterium]
MPISLLAIAVASLVLSAASGYAAAGGISGFEQRRQCDIVFEPSGLTQLPDGRVVVVDDEKSHPISILTLDDRLMLSVEPLQIEPLFYRPSEHETRGALNDLEALARDNHGCVYAITSHS